jgi:hypothetical protein
MNHAAKRKSMHPDPREDNGIFDNLVRAQHYALPTRLLDISLNPLVALYFSVCSKKDKRASVVVFKPDIGKQKYFDSDVVSCLSALSLLTPGEKNSIVYAIVKTFIEQGSSKRIASERSLNDFNNTTEVRKLIELVQREKPYSAAKIQPIDLVNAVAVVPRKLHSRIIAQNGAFVIFGVGKTENAIVEENITTVDAESKVVLDDYLNGKIIQDDLTEKAALGSTN